MKRVRVNLDRPGEPGGASVAKRCDRIVAEAVRFVPIVLQNYFVRLSA